MKISAPSKINLHLEVKDKRPDGFHNLESLFVCLGFGDELYFELKGEMGVWNLNIDPASCPDAIKTGFLGENNLITRAVSLFRAKTSFNHGLKCVLSKKIPLGAGLGGGSSNAASTLLALNELAKTDLPESELLDMALSLGSDVPFFIKAGLDKANAALVKGRGEHIKTLPLAVEYPVLLIIPPFQSNTAEAFTLLKKYRKKQGARVSSHFLPDAFLEKTLGLSPDKWDFFNDFLDVLPHKKTYHKILQELKHNGALFSGLSGSGSSCFGVFKDEKTAKTAENTLKSSKLHKNFIHLTFFLAKITNQY